MKINRKRLTAALLFGLCISVAVSYIKFGNECKNIRKNVLRLHIVANSDCAADQRIKLAVKDEVVKTLGEKFCDCNNLNQAKSILEKELPHIIQTAQNTVNAAGCDLKVSGKLCNEYFGTRVYDDFTLPAGKYDSLTLNIGKGDGHNWWCVIFPSVCVPTGDGATFDKTVGKGGLNVIYGGGKYVIKFRVIEIFEDIKRRIM